MIPDMEPAKQFARELAVTYTDWRMDDPLVVFANCWCCKVDKLCRPVVLFTLPSPGVQPSGTPQTEEWMFCRPCNEIARKTLARLGVSVG
jgi:hypothetical protein